MPLEINEGGRRCAWIATVIVSILYGYHLTTIKQTPDVTGQYFMILFLLLFWYCMLYGVLAFFTVRHCIGVLIGILLTLFLMKFLYDVIGIQTMLIGIGIFFLQAIASISVYTVYYITVKVRLEGSG